MTNYESSIITSHVWCILTSPGMAANPGVISISRKNTDHKREEVGNFFKVFFNNRN